MNIYGKIAGYFIDNKQLSFLVMVGIVLWGVISFVIMPKQYNPDIVAPSFSIHVDFPGATVDEVYQIVTKPLEDVLNEIPGVENIYSTSVNGGYSNVVCEFFVGENMEQSMILLRQKISSRLNLKPLGVSEPYITTIDPEDLPIKTYALYSAALSPVQLRERAFKLRDELRDTEDVSLIEVIGGRQREFQIILDPQKMIDTRTSFDEINAALANTSLLKELGVIKTETKYHVIETQEQVFTTADIENIVIISNVEKHLRIKDVARVIQGEKEYEQYVSFYNKEKNIPEAVYISLSKKKGTNIVQVGKNIDNALKKLQAREKWLDDISIETVKDEGRVAQEEISGLVINLLEAISIVFLVLLAFLNHRAAFIVAFSIPLTLLTVFALGNLFGYTINRITLFALILSLGLLVDSATVVIENIVRSKKEHTSLSKGESIARSVSEVGMGLFLSTLTTVLAFVPMAFVTGMMGPYMGPLPFFVSAALIVALIFAYTMNPWLAFMFCKDSIESDIPRRCGVLCKIVTSFVEKYKNILVSLLESAKKRRTFLISCFVLMLIAMLFPILTLVRFRMLPKADREQIFAYIDLDRGTSLERTQSVATYVASELKKEPNITTIQSFVGVPPVLDFNGLFRGVSNRRGSHQITLKLNLTHPKERKEKSEHLALRYRTKIATLLEPYPKARFVIVEDPPGPPVKSTFYVKVKTEDADLLKRTIYDLESKVRTIRGVEDVDVSLLEDVDKYTITIDKTAAAKGKVSVESISHQLETVFSSKIIGVYHSDYNYEQEYITLRFDRSLRDNIEDLDNIYVSNSVGIHVPVSQFVTVRTHTQEDKILSDNRERVAYISGEMGQRSVTYAAIDFLKLIAGYNVPDAKSRLDKLTLIRAEFVVDETRTLNVELGGEWKLTVEVFRDLGTAMAVAIILIYLVLVAQFRSFLIPFLILITIPLSLIGVMPGFTLLFLLMRVYFSATSMIGVIALAGIVVNNAIIFIEYTMQTAKKYESFKGALIDAGMTRMRPIMLTSITTILGSLVIAMDPVWSGLAWSIVFGLSLSSVLTLVVFPCLLYEFLGETWYKTL